MKKSRYTDEQIAFALKQAETDTPVAEVIRQAVARPANDKLGEGPSIHRDAAGVYPSSQNQAAPFAECGGHSRQSSGLRRVRVNGRPHSNQSPRR